MKFPIVSIVLMFVLSSCASVQAWVQEAWVATYNAGLAQGTNRAVAMALDSQGNVIVAGSSTGAAGDFDYLVLKYAPNGSLAWSNRYDSPSHGQDEVRAMKIGHDNSVVVCGTTKTVKFRTGGEVEWVIDYPAEALAIDGANSVYLVGHRPTEFATLKVAANGTNAWERIKSFGFGPNYSQVVCLDGATNVYVAGWINCSPDPRTAYRDDRIVSYDAQGIERWVSTPGLVNCIGARVDVKGIGIDAFGHVTYTFNQHNSIFVTISYESSGPFRWEYALEEGVGFSKFAGVTSMIADEYGNVCLTGISRAGGISPYGTVKLNSGGAPVWIRQYGKNNGVYQEAFANAIGFDGNGNVTVTGESPGAGNDIATVQYSSEGQEKWVRRYDGPVHGDDGALALAVGPQGEVYVAGYQSTTANLVELVVIKYSELANITMQPDKTASLQFFGPPGQSNRVQATTNFAGWLDLGFSVADPNGILHFLDTNAPAFPFRFYRTVAP
jgi:hypothetical protein